MNAVSLRAVLFAGAAALFAPRASATADESAFRPLGAPGDTPCSVSSLWVGGDGREVFAGCEGSPGEGRGGSFIAHSSDGGASFSPVRGELPMPPRRRSPAFALWGRSARDLWAVGYAGSLWHTSDGERWLRVEGAGELDLLAVGGNANGMVVAGGERGVAVVSRDGVSFRTERTGCRGRIRAVWVDEDGRAVVASERAELAERSARGRWRMVRRASRGDVFAALLLDEQGRLVVLSEAGRLRRSSDRGHTFSALPPLPLGSRSYCDALALDGKRATLLCHRARPGTELRMEPPMQAYLLFGPGLEGPFREEPAPDAIRVLWARPGSGVTWAGGHGLWRRD